MKRQFAILTVILLVVALWLTRCNKDDDTPAKTKTQLIAQSSWRFSGVTVNGINAAAFIPTCQKDNILTFATNNSGTSEEGLTKCNVGDPPTVFFTWSFQNNETTLFVSATLFTGGSSTFNLVSLTETELVLSQMITLNGSQQNAVVAFVH